MDKETYLQKAAASRDRRMAWWREARFGMFVHWGLYSQLGRHEWAMNRECIPVADYERLADTWKPEKQPVRDWARIAVQAGMKYIVMTTKHHDGFCLWDTRQTDFNAVRRGPQRDLVREYVEACREAGLKVGLYYSLMDWHHPDGVHFLLDNDARRRFLDFTRACLRELLSNYGPVDILWYDGGAPHTTPEGWETYEANAMARELQPDIIINNRARLDEDFGTPEGQVSPQEGRDWEACMTFNGAWGYMPSAIDWLSPREVIRMLRTCAGGGGNLLLNVGPAPDGSVPPQAAERLEAIGRWIAQNGEALYGRVDPYTTHRADSQMDWNVTGAWSLKGNVAYYWCHRWPGEQLVIGGLRTRVRKASILATGESVAFEQTAMRLVMKGLPATNPDAIAGTTIIKLECDGTPRQAIGTLYGPAMFHVFRSEQSFRPALQPL